MARKGKSDKKTKAGKSAKVGRNDPCPCGSGKKYKQCCLLQEQETARERRNAEQARPVEPKPVLDEPLPETLEADEFAEPAPSTAEGHPLDPFWDEFEKADYEGKIALFHRALESDEIELDGEIVIDMFDVFYRETLKQGERTRFKELVNTLRQATPELYADKKPYFLSWIMESVIADSHREDVAETIQEFSTVAAEDVDLYFRALDQLEYRGYLDLLAEAATIAWPQIKESKKITPWGIDEFAQKAVDYHIFQYLERHPQARGDEPELLTCLTPYIDPRPEGIRHYCDWITGRVDSTWTEADFGHNNEQFFENLHHLSLEFLGYLHREKQVPYTKAEQARRNLKNYFVKRHEGDLPVDKEKRKIRHPLCPDQATFDKFLGGLLQFLNHQIYKAAVTFEFIPVWLTFLQGRELITDLIRIQTLENLKPLHEPLLKMYQRDQTDPALFDNLEHWPYEG